LPSSSTRPLRNPALVESDYALLRETVESALRTRYHQWIFREGPLPYSHLFELLARELPYISEAEWQTRADFGGVYLNGHPALTDQKLPTPCRIEYYEPKFSLAEVGDVYPQVTGDHIVFSDGDIAVAYKPARLPTMPAKEQRHFSLKHSLERILDTTVHMPSRLDVSVSGLVVVSTSPKMHAPLQHAFEKRQVMKRYLLLTSHRPSSDEWACDARIGEHPAHPVLRSAVSDGGQDAKTRFVSSKSSADQSRWLVNAYPVTGRTHQIRVHAAHSGIPIVGDRFYGGEKAEMLHLLSYEVSFQHPLTGRTFSCRVPEGFCPGWVKTVR
jgi:23S rRNA-/tRNA-specific pseudouridylate synthase